MGVTTNSNTTGLRIAEEVIGTPKTLPGTPVWEPMEPNGYGDFGAEVTTAPRNPIAADRQRRKGPVVDLDASGGFTADFTAKSFVNLIQGFMFANWRKKSEARPTAVTATGYTVASGGAAFTTSSLIFAEGFNNPNNNGLKVAGNSTATSVLATGLTVEAGVTGATVTRVGFEFAAGVLTVTVAAGVVTIGGTSLNTHGLIPGEWFWLGGDAAITRYDTAANNGWYRVRTVTATAIVCDRAPDGVATDAGASKTIRMFTGHVVKNEADPALQVIRSYQLERTLASGQFQYLVGAAANSLELTIGTGEKIEMELNFVALDEETPAVAKTGTRPAVPAQSAYNSTSDFMRLRLQNDTSGTALAAYMTDLSLTIDNGVETAKAIGSLGGIDFTLGDFMVNGDVEVYFSTTEAIRAVRENADVSLDFGLVTMSGGNPVGWLFDVPLITLGDARLNIEKDSPIKLPLNIEAAAHGTLNHTLLVQHFAYLPNLTL